MAMSKPKLVTVDTFTVAHETDAAYLLDIGASEKVWVPKSQVEIYDDGTMTLPEWLAMEKGII